MEIVLRAIWLQPDTAPFDGAAYIVVIQLFRECGRRRALRAGTLVVGVRHGNLWNRSVGNSFHNPKCCRAVLHWRSHSTVATLKGMLKGMLVKGMLRRLQR